MTLFGVSGRLEILMRWRDINATGILLERERPVLAAAAGARACGNNARLHSGSRNTSDTIK